MTYCEALKFLYEALPMFQREGAAAYKPGLGNTLAFNALIGDPASKFESIHIAGTNGKGSTSHMLASVLMAAGRRVGLFTSPHLKDFRERIRVDGEMIPEAEVIAFTERWQEEMVGRGLTFFEMCTALAFSYFADRQVDIAIVEAGLGGRLDATNILLPKASIITNIGLDHTQQLGETLPEIAAEKAGIVKRGVPLIVGSHQTPEVDEVFARTALALDAPLTFADDVGFDTQLDSDLAGHYQRKNIPAVRVVAGMLGVPPEAIAAGLRQVQRTTGLKGRWQIVGQAPLVICDTAHNAHGMREVVAQLNGYDCRNLLIVIGLVADKDADTILALLPKEARYFFTQPATPRALESEILMKMAAQYGLHGEAYQSVKEALELSKAAALPEDLIFIGGSNYVVAEIPEL